MRIGALLSVVIVISIATLGLLSWIVEKEVILNTLRAMGMKVEKQSTRALLPYYFNLDNINAVGPVDRRPVAQWNLCKGKTNCAEYTYNIYVRAKAGDEIFEGRVTRLVFLLMDIPRRAIVSGARRACILRRWAGTRTDHSSAVLAR